MLALYKVRRGLREFLSQKLGRCTGRSGQSTYHSHTAYDGAEQEDHVLMDLLAPLQQDVEELHKAKGGQQETQHLNGRGKYSNRRLIRESVWISSHICQNWSVDIGELVGNS